VNRREFLRLALGVALGASSGSSLFTRPLRADPAVGGLGPYGALQAADANGLMLPQGFRSRVIATSRELVPGTSFVWHDAPDGGAVFPSRAAGGYPSGYIYVSNSERNGTGGVGAIRFDWRGDVLDAYSICQNTNRNCAGGVTPWGTWLSCEEVGSGIVYECDPTGAAAQIPRPALGTFKHEAATVDPLRGRIYLTEDRSSGLFYRFTPDVWGDLSTGLLEAAEVAPDGTTTWAPVPNPNPIGSETPTRDQLLTATSFAGGEGAVYSKNHVYFATKGNNRVWDYDIVAKTITVFYDDDTDPATQLSGVDNVGASRAGDILIAEDPGNLEIVLLSRDCIAAPIVRITGQSGTEVTGPALDPTGRRLYFSSQRGGPTDDGITYEVEGPFRRVGG
jgi:secreted PhoX family phosphatase